MAGSADVGGGGAAPGRRAGGAGPAGGAPTDLATAVAASCAIPGYFRPVVINGEAYVDGGVHSGTNADLVSRLGLGLLIVSSPMSASPAALAESWRRWDLGARAFFHRQVTREVRGARRRGVPVLLLEPDTASLGALSFSPLRGDRIDEVEENAYEQTVRALGRHAAALRVLEDADEVSGGGVAVAVS